MMRPGSFLLGLVRDRAGAMAVETAIIAPLMVMFSLGAYQVSSLVARQSELQSAMSVAESIALATDPDTTDELTTLKNVVAATTGLASEQINVAAAYRCNSSASYVALESTCATGDNVSRYVQVTLTDDYVPIWTEFGLGSSIALRVNRYVLYGQRTKA
jgi:Flp pilus assembly protein TadG